MRFAFIARHQNIWPVAWLCNALDVSRSGFHAWLNRSPSARSRHDEVLVTAIDRSFKSSDRTYGARRVWHDVLAEGLSCGLHRIERLMRRNGLRARRRVSEFCLRGRTANIGGRDRLVWVEEPGGSALELPAVAAHRAYLEALANWEREFYAAQCPLSQSGH